MKLKETFENILLYYRVLREINVFEKRERENQSTTLNVRFVRALERFSYVTVRLLHADRQLLVLELWLNRPDDDVEQFDDYDLLARLYPVVKLQINEKTNFSID